MHLIERVKGILLRPDSEWRAIAQEPNAQLPLLLNYVAILALIPALAGFIGMSLIGNTTSAGTFHTPPIPGLVNAVISYIFSFVIVYVVALLIDLTAPFFRAQRSFPQALKLSVYSFTPIWLAGIFLLIPVLGFLTALGLFALFPLWIGLPVLMQAPRPKALAYALVVFIGAIAVTAALAVIQLAIVMWTAKF